MTVNLEEPFDNLLMCVHHLLTIQPQGAQRQNSGDGFGFSFSEDQDVSNVASMILTACILFVFYSPSKYSKTENQYIYRN